METVNPHKVRGKSVDAKSIDLRNTFQLPVDVQLETFMKDIIKCSRVYL